MPSYLDLGVIGVVLVSAILAMMRGFTREILAIASWVAAGAAAYFFYPQVTPYLTPYIHKENIAQAVAAAAVFLVSLIVVSLITVRISDAILDSRIGALDRSLGFVFGAVRGFLLAVVAFFLFNWLVAEQQQPEWVKAAKTKPILIEAANRIVALLPEDAAAKIEAWIKAKGALGGGEDTSDDAAPAPTPTASSTPSPTPSATKPQGALSPSPSSSAVGDVDKAKLDQLINRGVPLPAPPSPVVVPTPTPTPKKT